MAFRRRRKRIVAWLPTAAPDNSEFRSWWSGALTVPAASNTIANTVVIAMLPDYPAEAVRVAGALPSISDYEGSGYSLRRIVGKLTLGTDQLLGVSQGVSYPDGILVGAGIIVLKVLSDTGAPLRFATPDDYSPLELDNLRDPWIWRRTWCLSNPFGFNPTKVYGYNQFPTANTDFGSVSDGPHIDIKTRRTVKAEERLFICMTATNLGDASSNTGGVRFVLEYRALATPLRIMGNRRNASR